MVHFRPDHVVASALAASEEGVPDAENARRHGVAVKTIRRWRRLYQRRGQPRGQPHLTAACPRCDDGPLMEQAYAELLGWYLGDGYLSTQRRGVFGLHIYNDAQYAEVNRHIAELICLVKPRCRPHTRQLPGCVVTTASWKHWPCLFPQHGPGRKHERHLGMQPWQWRIVEEFPADFLRGLFHSDGCRVANWATRTVAGERRRYDYPRWQFVNASEEILRWCGDALGLVDVAGRRTISVSRRADVARLDFLIGLKT